MEDERLEQHRKNLERAIKKALTESVQISTAIQNIREVGYDVFLVMEATIGFNHREEAPLNSKQTSSLRLNLTSQDEKFLKSLKISLE
tara:strand:+ start:174 stop:437 length:264 start_codon:yes stop_codon:yes gene_type:complete